MSLQDLLGRRRNAKTLRNLTINEVSSVNAGAGRGVRVVMLKSEKGTEPMQPMTTFQKAQRVLETVDNPNAIAKVLAELAAEEGLTLAQAHQTEWGKRLLQKSITGHYADTLLSAAVGDGWDVAQTLSKADADGLRKNSMSGERGTAPGARRHNRADSRHVQGDDLNPTAQGASEGSANKSACEQFEDLAQAYAKAHGVNLDLAYQAVSATSLGKALLSKDAATHGIHR